MHEITIWTSVTHIGSKSWQKVFVKKLPTIELPATYVKNTIFRMGVTKKNLVRARIFDVVCYTFKNKLKNFIWLRSENHLKCIVFWCEYVEQFSAIVFFLYAYAGIPQTAWFHDIWVFCTKGFQINIHIIRPKLIIGGLTCKKHYFADFCIMLQMCTISCAAEIESNSTQHRLHYIEDFV